MSEELRGSVPRPKELGPAEPAQLEELRHRRQLDRSEHKDLARHRERPRRGADAEPEGYIEKPTEQASIQIESKPVTIKMDAHGPLALGIVGPAATIIVGYLAHLPVWAIMAVCALQIVASVVVRGRR
jgi:hypothetical protein